MNTLVTLFVSYEYSIITQLPSYDFLQATHTPPHTHRLVIQSLAQEIVLTLWDQYGR